MKNKDGFTLIELLSTLIILGIIATIAIQSYNTLIIKNDDSKYNYYWKFIEKASDLYFDAGKNNMIDGECLSVNYQTLVDKDYLKEEGVTCTGNIILKKENKKYVYDDTNIECKSNNKIVKEKGEIEAVCPVTQVFTFDDNYERLNDIATTMTSNIDKWENVSTTHTVKKAYDLASSKNITFAECSGECGIYQNLTDGLKTEKSYSWSVLLKANSGKTLKVGVGTNGIKTITTTGEWQKVSGDFIAESTDASKFNILSTNGWQTSDDLYVNSVIVYEKNQSLKNKLAFEIDVPFGESLPTPRREGYEFVGWFTEKDGGVQITKTTIVPKTKNIIYYAHWVKKNLKVNYLANGGTGIMVSDTLSYGSDYKIKTNTYTKVGHTFSHWKNNSENFSIWEETPVTWTFDEDISLLAEWNKNMYTLTFNPNGGNVSQTTKTVVYTDKYGELPTPTRTGHTFTNWYTQLTEGVKITKDTEVTTPSNHTLYAMWEANTYTVTFDATGGNTPSPQTKSVTYGKTYGTLPTTSKSNYNFLGWYTASSGGSKISSSSTVNITSDIKLYAHWEKKITTKTWSGDLYNWTGTSHSEYGSKHSISGHTKYELKYEQEGGNPNPDYGVVNLYYYKGGTKYKLDNGTRTGGHAEGTLKGDIPSGATHLQVAATGYTGDVSYTLKAKP